MSAPRPLLLLSLLSVGFLVPAFVSGEVVLANPGFVDQEKLTYTETIGTSSRPFETTLTNNRTTGRVEFRSVGADQESVYRFDPVTLVSISSDVVVKAGDATVTRRAEYTNLRPKPRADDMVISDMGSLPLALRGFPWTRTSAQMLYVGNTSYGSSMITFELQVVGRQNVVAAGRTWDCWHVTTGLGGALSIFLSKTDWWFAVEGTHLLVKTSGPLGGPGSPTRTLLLQSYSR